MTGAKTASEPTGDDDVTAIVRFPVGDLDGVVDVELPDELAHEFRHTLSDLGLTPITRLRESVDPGSATIIAATIAGSAQVFIAALTAFLSRTSGRRTGRQARIEVRADGSRTVVLNGHTAREEKALLELFHRELIRQDEQNRQHREAARRSLGESDQ